jgi:hypothetical protein
MVGRTVARSFEMTFLHVILNIFAHHSEIQNFEMKGWQDGGRVYLSPPPIFVAKYAYPSNPQQSPYQIPFHHYDRNTSIQLFDTCAISKKSPAGIW